MAHQLKRTGVRLKTTFFILGVYLHVSLQASHSQEIKYEDRIGSIRDFDVCEDFRFKRITKLVKDGKISQQQGYNIWKRIRSDEKAVKRVLSKAVAAKELTEDQAKRLLPLLGAKMSYSTSRHGLFGQPKELKKGKLKAGEVTAKNRAAVYQRLIAANERGEMYDYDVASIMKQLYAGFDPEKAPIEEVAIYRGALNPRIAQSGSQARVLQNARAQRSSSRRDGYGAAKLKITDPAEWIKNLEKPIYSGPQPGEKVPSLKAINLRGEKAGQEFDPVKLAGDKLHLMFFVRKSRTFGRFLGQLRNQLQSIEKNSKQAWAMSIIVCTDDVNTAEKSFAILDRRYPKNLIVGISKHGSAGPPAYGLDKNLTATVIVVKNGRVTHNFPYAGDAFYAQPNILGAVANAMKVDHDTLRKYIADTPGDAAAVAYARRSQANKAGFPAPQRGFRNKVAPLVSSKKLTRADASQLFLRSGDKVALQKKIDEFVKAKKLTREEAKKLLKNDKVDGDRNR